MDTYLIPLFFAVFIWWFSTGLVFMTDGRAPQIVGREQDRGALSVSIVRERSAYGRHRAQRIVRNGDCQDASPDRRHSFKHRFPISSGMAALKARPPETPFIGDAGGEILEPAEALARKVTEEGRQDGHDQMPFEKQSGALARGIVAPPGILSAYRQHSLDLIAGFCQAGDKAANAVADNLEGTFRTARSREAEDGIEVQFTPVSPAITAILQPLRP